MTGAAQSADRLVTVEFPDGSRALVPELLIYLIEPDDFYDAGLRLPGPCADCGQDTTPRDGPSEYYMVHDELWAIAGMDGDVEGDGDDDGVLCIGCLERRLGRTLEAADFTGAPINQPNGRDSERLAARKTPPRRRRPAAPAPIRLALPENT